MPDYEPAIIQSAVDLSKEADSAKSRQYAWLSGKERKIQPLMWKNV